MRVGVGVGLCAALENDATRCVLVQGGRGGFVPQFRCMGAAGRQKKILRGTRFSVRLCFNGACAHRRARRRQKTPSKPRPKSRPERSERGPVNGGGVGSRALVWAR